MEFVANSIPKRFQAVSGDDFARWTLGSVEADPCWALKGVRGSESAAEAHGRRLGHVIIVTEHVFRRLRFRLRRLRRLRYEVHMWLSDWLVN